RRCDSRPRTQLQPLRGRATHSRRRGALAQRRRDHLGGDALMAHDIDIVVTIARRWKLVVTTALLGGVIATCYAFLAPEWYAATLAVVPSQQHNRDLGALAIAAKLPGALDPFAADVQRIQAVLASNSVADEVIDKFDLETRYRESH